MLIEGPYEKDFAFIKGFAAFASQHIYVDGAPPFGAPRRMPVRADVQPICQTSDHQIRCV